MLNVKFLENAMNKKEILSGEVTMWDKEKGLLVEKGKFMIIIPTEEIELFKEKPSYNFLVGTRVFFTIKEIQNNIVIASRKEAQTILKPQIIEKLENGETISARISNIKSYGAFVEMKGVSGLIKNYDFTDEPKTIKDILKVGSRIDVKLKRISETGDIHLAAASKYVNRHSPKFEDFKTEQVVVGVVTAIKPIGCFVRIGSGVDALCSYPDFEISEDNKVQVYISKIKEDERKIAGKVIKVIQ